MDDGDRHRLCLADAADRDWQADGVPQLEPPPGASDPISRIAPALRSQRLRLGGDEVTDRAHRPAPDWPFYLGFGLLGGSYLVLILAMLAADFFYTTPGHLIDALNSDEIRYSIRL